MATKKNEANEALKQLAYLASALRQTGSARRRTPTPAWNRQRCGDTPVLVRISTSTNPRPPAL
ncbi:MAG TPA: hypothetical protein VFH56_16535 [Acidimicrobiales bacterium]|nr:hypothetical protein [Acidimicrobiales bacterium]